MADICATITAPAVEFTRKNGTIGSYLEAAVMSQVTARNGDVFNPGDTVRIYGKGDKNTDPFLFSLELRTTIFIAQSNPNTHFWNIIKYMGDDGSLHDPPGATDKPAIKPSAPTNNNNNKLTLSIHEPEEIKKVIRFHAKMIDYCLEQSPQHGMAIWEEICKRIS